MKKKKRYISPASDFVCYETIGNIMGAVVSIVKSEEKVEDGESWDAKEYIGSWEKIWSNDTVNGEWL